MILCQLHLHAYTYEVFYIFIYAHSGIYVNIYDNKMSVRGILSVVTYHR